LETTRKLFELLDEEDARILKSNFDDIAEIRMRIGRPVRFCCLQGKELSGKIIGANQFRRILNRLMDNSLYSREEELKQGYFTTADGWRVGVCGKMLAGRAGVDNLANIGSVCIRIPREIQGCAAVIYEKTMGKGLSNVLLLSQPGIGKTTLLRDLARIASNDGWNVAIADERREIAACMEGVPQLDVGARTDVMDGCPKKISFTMLIRSVKPDLLIADEIGGPGDRDAIVDAMNSGVCVAASAHARNIEQAGNRESIAPVLRDALFDWCVLLGPGRGCVKQIIPMHKCAD